MTNCTEAELKDRAAKQKLELALYCAYRKFLADQHPHALVTLSINRGANRLESNRNNLAKWAYYVDCLASGKARRIARLKPEQRIRGWFVNEKQNTNSHWHGLVIFPEAFTSAWQGLKLSMIFNRAWQQIVPSGNAYTDATYLGEGAAGYFLKESFKGDDFYGSLIELSEFWPASKPGRIR